MPAKQPEIQTPILVNEIVQETQVNKPKSISELIKEFSTGTTTEISMAIVGAESQFKNVCNKDGCLYGIGPFMIVQSTFDEQCSGTSTSTLDNLKCGFKMIKEEQYWRWDESWNKWLPKLSTTTQDYIKERCFCVYAVNKWGLKTPAVWEASEIKSNSTPGIGVGILMDYEGIGHIALIRAITRDGFWVREANYIKCKITERLVPYNDPHIVGFYSD